MTKKEALIEILSRIKTYIIAEGLPWFYGKNAFVLLEYHAGGLSEEELFKMITQDEDGNVLQEPTTISQFISDEHEKYYKLHQKYRTQAEQLLKEYLK